ncbi:rhodanese-like domain-containing protein [Planctomicrobium sp. SH527]|uniref:rhodanese-like domain-containing protein n=1 Tax=Planctomicrobium sp. SH527 TaxID=3448123 RepID=UPI003F5B4F74
MNSISPTRLLEQVQAGEAVELIDVRTQREFLGEHLELARNEPLSQLDPAKVMQSRTGESGAPLYVICQSGMRSRSACDRFRDAGFHNVVNVEGGTKACLKAGFPAIHRLGLSQLERHARVLNGAIVLVAALLTYFVDPRFLWVSAFMGAGLMFSGFSGYCGWARILPRLTWKY